MIRLVRSAYDAVVDHAVEGTPEEVCGLLVGSGDRVEAVRRATNTADDPRSTYEIAPTDLLTHLDAVETGGDEVVGFYHSHPRGPPRPSPTDRRDAAWPDHAYLLVSLGGTHPVVGSWRWTGEQFEAEPVLVG